MFTGPVGNIQISVKDFEVQGLYKTLLRQFGLAISNAYLYRKDNSLDHPIIAGRIAEFTRQLADFLVAGKDLVVEEDHNLMVVNGRTFNAESIASGKLLEYFKKYKIGRIVFHPGVMPEEVKGFIYIFVF